MIVITEYQIALILSCVLGSIFIGCMIAFLFASTYKNQSMWFGAMITFFLVFILAKSYVSRFDACPSCGKYMKTDYCTYCGETINVDDKRICPACNTEWDTNFCGNCGVKLETTEEVYE